MGDQSMTTALILSPSHDLVPAPLFAPSPRAAHRFVEFFTAQINNHYTGKACLNATRRLVLSALVPNRVTRAIFFAFLAHQKQQVT